MCIRAAGHERNSIHETRFRPGIEIVVDRPSARRASRSRSACGQRWVSRRVRWTLGGAAPPTLALGVAPREAGQFALAVRVQQRALEQGREVELIRRAAKGEVDVRYIGEVRKRAVPWYQSRLRPLRIGGSVGHFKVTAGTLGGFVRPRGGGPLALLSNNHVLANENRGKRGDAVLQPGDFDGGANAGRRRGPAGRVVRLKRGRHELPWTPPWPRWSRKRRGRTDQADRTGQLARRRRRVPGRRHAGGRSWAAPRACTRGHVTAFELDNVMVEFDIGVLRFDNQIEIEGERSGAVQRRRRQRLADRRRRPPGRGPAVRRQRPGRRQRPRPDLRQPDPRRAGCVADGTGRMTATGSATMSKACTLDEARAAKPLVEQELAGLADVVGVGITRVGRGYGLKVNLSQTPASPPAIPTEVAGVPVRRSRGGDPQAGIGPLLCTSFHASFPGSAWERTVLPALPAECEAEPRGRWVTRQSLLTRAGAAAKGLRRTEFKIGGQTF